MKPRSKLLFSALILTLITACAALGVAKPETFNEKEAAAISTVTAVRDTAIGLLTADKITAADARNIQQQADNAREGITVASAIHATDPAQAENRLAAVVTGLNALNAYLATRK
jgi:hypothetical protein